MLIGVGLNVVLMVIERYGDGESVLVYVCSIGEICFVGVYLIEVLL